LPATFSGNTEEKPDELVRNCPVSPEEAVGTACAWEICCRAARRCIADHFAPTQRNCQYLVLNAREPDWRRSHETPDPPRCRHRTRFRRRYRLQQDRKLRLHAEQLVVFLDRARHHVQHAVEQLVDLGHQQHSQHDHDAERQRLGLGFRLRDQQHDAGYLVLEQLVAELVHQRHVAEQLVQLVGHRQHLGLKLRHVGHGFQLHQRHDAEQVTRHRLAGGPSIGPLARPHVPRQGSRPPAAGATAARSAGHLHQPAQARLQASRAPDAWPTRAG
jgi:hypothetical protein